jgi:hypothetical protein
MDEQEVDELMQEEESDALTTITKKIVESNQTSLNGKKHEFNRSAATFTPFKYINMFLLSGKDVKLKLYEKIPDISCDVCFRVVVCFITLV